MRRVDRDARGAAMSGVQGTCEDRFGAVRAALEENLGSGEELGASVYVDLDGERVVDLWGGFRDESRTTPWTEHTVTNVWSTTETVTNLAAMMLIDRGELDPFAPVARYWPEFAASGKGAIEVRHLLSHTSGVAGWDQPVTVEDCRSSHAAVRSSACACSPRRRSSRSSKSSPTAST
jgi:CubicO group peptidase (beta-lactamase class C family)